MMFVLGSISVVFVLAAVVLIIVRLSIDARLVRIQSESNHSRIFLRKLNHVIRTEQARHIRYLLLVCIVIGLAAMVIFSSVLVLTKDHQKMKTQTHEMSEQIIQLTDKQKSLTESIPLKVYPEEGIGLNNQEWEKLIVENKDSTVEKQMESMISQKTWQYFGSSETKVSLAVPETMSLQIKGWTGDSASKETIKKNIDAFAKEAETISKLKNIYVQMIFSISKEEQVVYIVNYSRESNEGVFSKKNVSEQNLKNDGGKG